MLKNKETYKDSKLCKIKKKNNQWQDKILI